MKTLIFMFFTILGACNAYADDSSTDKILVTGELANKIAELSFLDKGAIGSSVFVTGVVQVKCFKKVSLEINEGEAPVSADFKCFLIKP